LRAVKASPDIAGADASLAQQLARRIASDGPLTVADYMAEANACYYATRDPFGRDGDFITAPEISQMFGELVGLWLADLWLRSGRPEDCRYVELGPGRGTLATDALRAMKGSGLTPAVEFVETSPILKRAQAERVPHARWHDGIASLPDEGPLLIVANEFFDALPIRQFVAGPAGWSERMVDHVEGRFVPFAGAPVEDGPRRPAVTGTICESSPLSMTIVADIAERIAAQGGAALIIDYGHVRSCTGETLQAVRAHEFADPWTTPGENDLTAHVDFEALSGAATSDGVAVFGPVEQGAWLGALGIDVRAAALCEQSPERADEVEAARLRLTADGKMGSLFKVMALVASGWAEPAGF